MEVSTADGGDPRDQGPLEVHGAAGSRQEAGMQGRERTQGRDPRHTKGMLQGKEQPWGGGAEEAPLVRRT